LLRALAALSVVYLHVVSDAGLNLGIGVGNFGVDLFFVISGFTISYVGHMPAGAFLIRRLVRIVPLYWGATLGTYAIALVAPGKIQSASADISHLLHSLAFLPYKNKLGQLLPTLALGWSLNYEMYFYGLFALALLISIRWAPVIATTFLIIAGLAISLTGPHGDALNFYAKPIILEFTLGIGVFYLINAEWVKRWLQPNQVQWKWLLLACAVLGFAALPIQELYSKTDRAWTAGPPAFLVVASTILLETRYGLTTKKRFITLLGDASYVLYLIHPYVLYGLIRLFLNPSAMGPVAMASAVVILPVIATAIAVAIHVYLEKPVLEFLRERLISKGKNKSGAARPVVA
jgi:peptidoglycan/LPS O-acetylase OafA/YrhL